MKRTTRKQRHITKHYNFLYRTGVIHWRRSKRGRKKGKKGQLETSELLKNIWKFVAEKRNQGLEIYVNTRNEVTVTLPEVLDLKDNYELTTLYFEVIRKLGAIAQYRGYRGALVLKSVNFDNIRRISSSAALRLTAELSRWEDSIRNRLTPRVSGWNPEILSRFIDLGFFDLFKSPPSLKGLGEKKDISFVKYIKGSCINKDYSSLKTAIKNLVGEEIRKWTFLHSGLDEAITNVGHHAYPDSGDEECVHKNWYLTGAFDKNARTLKIVFYDQGIGIPRSLPESSVWERVINYMERLGVEGAEKKKDELLLKAAVEVSRTRTNAIDRGKGLSDMLEFIKQRREGYLSLISQHGLYKYSMKNGKENTKTYRFENPTMGTLIIWKVQL